MSKTIQKSGLTHTKLQRKPSGHDAIGSRNYKNAKAPSQIIQDDTPTELSYLNPKVNFDPKVSTSTINYTSSRVAKPVYNKYASDSNKPEVFGYYTDWSQYDGRLSTDSKPITDDPNSNLVGFGRGRDLALLDPCAYDRIILGFLGIVGDKGEKGHIVSAAATALDKTEDEVTFIDPWGDIAAWQNNYFTQGEWSAASGGDIGAAVPYKHVMNQTAIAQGKAFGILGGLYKKQQDALRLGHKLNLGLSLGGWTLSGPFYELTKTPARRTKFVDSICKIFDAFPMFTHVDVDWEYPGTQGHDMNPAYDQDNDGPNYVLLMDEMRKKFDARYTGANHKHISIACAAPIDKIQHSSIPELINVGLDGINIMSYDFFGTPWADELGHHANLHPYGSTSGFSTAAAVEYLIANGVDSKRINVGWGAYSRNGQNAIINTASPLQGTYMPEGPVCLGTMESGTSEFYDIIKNYIDLENGGHKNGYALYTDAVANADYVYNSNNGMFMSFETPRATLVKGKYVAEHQLGGMFVWTIDIDNGLLANAARDGCGYHTTTETINMDQFYFCGSNISAEECALITGGGDSTINRPPVITIVPASLEMNEGEEGFLTASTTDLEGDYIASKWIMPSGLTIIRETSDGRIMFLAEDVTGDTNYVAVFEASDGINTVTKNVAIKVKDLNTGTPGACTDPAAVNYPAWNANTTYATGGILVSHNSLVWSSKYWTQNNEPGKSEHWALSSTVVANWSATLDYQANSVVNHQGIMWKSTGWMAKGTEPGAAGLPTWATWTNIGAAGCTPPSRNGRKHR